MQLTTAGTLDLAEETLAALEWAAEANMRAGEIISKLRELTLGREATKTILPLAPVLREAVAFATSGQSEVRVTVDVANLRSIRADKAQVQQVVINLIRNACDAAAGAAVDIRITARMRGAFVEVCVRDDGPGIPGEILPRIFDSFVTDKPGGTGIGLSICRTIIEAHGGNIHARNNPDGGASICFTLPAR